MKLILETLLKEKLDKSIFFNEEYLQNMQHILDTLFGLKSKKFIFLGNSIAQTYYSYKLYY